MYNFTTQAKLIKSRKINENSFRRLPTSAADAGGKSRSSAGNGGGGRKILIEKNRNLIRKIFSDLRRRSAGLLFVQICQNAGGIVSCTSPTSGLRRLRPADYKKWPYLTWACSYYDCAIYIPSTCIFGGGTEYSENIRFLEFRICQHSLSFESSQDESSQVKSSSGATRPRGDHPGPASYNFLPIPPTLRGLR